MTIVFSQKTLPELNSTKSFGFVQQYYTPPIFVEHSGEIPKCPQCECYLFPTKENNLICPNCSPNANYITDSIRIRSGFERTNFFIFIFDLSLPLHQTQMILNQMYDKMSDNSKILIMSLSGHTTLIYSQNAAPQFTTITDFSDFNPHESHFTSKNDLKSIIFPSLTALYSIFQNFERTPQDIITSLKISISFGRPALLICFLKRETALISVSTGSTISMSLAKVGISANFVASQNFRRLTAISRYSFGIVISFSEFSTTILDKLLSPSTTGPYSLKLIMPRGVEIKKVSGAEGSVNMTSSHVILRFSSARGCSALIERSSDRYGSKLTDFYALEVASTVFGKFLTLHRFIQNSEIPNQKQDLLLASIEMKIMAQSILKIAWNGEQIETILKRYEKSPIVSETSLANTQFRGDKDILILFYILHSLYKDTEYNVSIKKFKNGQIIFSPPIISIFSTDHLEGALIEAEKLCTNEWPFEIRIYNDFNEFKAFANSMNLHLEEK